jgi:GntR family transcriptional repressor for pyruvate dehydrogenase complex
MVEERAEVACLLNYMNENPDPVGSGTACEVLAGEGFQVSEATVGRLLRYMDLQGYTQRVGYKGRTLTDLGRRYINHLAEQKSRQHFSNKLAEIVRSQCLDDLLDTLVARRAIEREIARLAALNITPEQAEGLWRIVEAYKSAHGDRVADGDVAFHQALAEAAGNKVLKAALDLIRQDAQLSPVFGYIREQMHRKVFSDHKQIYDAVAARDPLAAERAMVNHIENLISDVQKYWNRASKSE